ncbi:hypothetical protein SNE40_010148 [Patella caerulea]|uniref:Succinate dehydrogenase assembly factor 3 n=1 Tax=Patella caerulea TaxID=87958 RepID=A0AAN8JXB4_PATCE
MSSPAISHISRVRALYKAILKLHRGLPLQMQALGDQYVKEEFRQHKTVSTNEASVFMTEWSKYYVTLAQQIGKKKPNQSNIGANLSPELLDCLGDEQIGQLHELLLETQKPRENL